MGTDTEPTPVTSEYEMSATYKKGEATKAFVGIMTMLTGIRINHLDETDRTSRVFQFSTHADPIRIYVQKPPRPESDVSVLAFQHTEVEGETRFNLRQTLGNLGSIMARLIRRNRD